MKSIILALLLPLSLLANESLNTNAASGTVVIGTLVQGDNHVDLRVHGVTLPGSKRTIASYSGFDIAIDSSGNLYLDDSVDTFTGINNYVQIAKPAGSTDFMIRAQRCVDSTTSGCTWIGGPFLEIEAWDISGSGYVSAISKITTVNSVVSGAVQIGNEGNLTAELAYFRWCSGTTPMNVIPGGPTIPPYPNGNAAPSSCNVIGDWELEGDGGDSGPHGYNLTFIGSDSYVMTPTPAPGCVLPQTTFSSAFPIQPSAIYCGSTQNSTALTYSWSYLGTGADGVSQTVAFSSSTAMNPTLTLTSPMPGSLNLQLIVTDSFSQSTTTTVHDGVVISDANHNIASTGNSNIDKLMMPMIQWGYNPYLYFDYTQKQAADFFGPLLTTTYSPSWNVAQAGTLACTSGSTTCTATGANLQTIFCSGGTSSDGSNIVIWWNSSADRGIYGISACPTSSTITLSSNYRTTNISGTSYSRWTNTDTGYWVNGSNNVNYYDNVVAYLGLYYRSGIDTYYTYGHTLGNNWWSMPYIDKGYSNDDGGVYPSLAPRLWSMEGLVLLALDGTISGFWPAVETNWEPQLIYQTATVQLTPGPIGDTREGSADIASLSYFALFDTGSGQSSAVTALGTSIGTATYGWAARQTGTGAFINISNGHAAWADGAAGTVTVSNGSGTVNGSGTSFQSGWIGTSDSYFATVGTNNPQCVAGDNWDTEAFVPTYVSGTQITISPVYAGGFPGAGRHFQFNNLVGCGVQPFMMGYNAHAMWLAYLGLLSPDPTNAAKAKTIILNDASWLETYGFMGTSAAPGPVSPSASVNALFYARVFIESEPNPWADQGSWLPCGNSGTNWQCTPSVLDGQIQGSRFLSGEIMSGMAYAHLAGDTSSIPATLYAANYGGLGGSSADSHYLWQYYGSPLGPGEDTTYVKQKDFGFAFGWGNGAIWPAVVAQASSPTGGSISGAGSISTSQSISR